MHVPKQQNGFPDSRIFLARPCHGTLDLFRSAFGRDLLEMLETNLQLRFALLELSK